MGWATCTNIQWSTRRSLIGRTLSMTSYWRLLHVLVDDTDHVDRPNMESDASHPNSAQLSQSQPRHGHPFSSGERWMPQILTIKVRIMPSGYQWRCHPFPAQPSQSIHPNPDDKKYIFENSTHYTNGQQNESFDEKASSRPVPYFTKLDSQKIRFTIKVNSFLGNLREEESHKLRLTLRVCDLEV